jgi:hypothetical protein
MGRVLLIGYLGGICGTVTVLLIRKWLVRVLERRSSAAAELAATRTPPPSPPATQPLGAGQTLRLDHSIEQARTRTLPSRVPEPALPPAPQARLRVSTASGGAILHELPDRLGALRIGAHDDADVPIFETGVAPRHLLLQRSGRAWLIAREPGAPEATVGEVPLFTSRPLPLPAGMAVRIGNATFVLEDEAADQVSASWRLDSATSGGELDPVAVGARTADVIVLATAADPAEVPTSTLEAAARAATHFFDPRLSDAAATAITGAQAAAGGRRASMAIALVGLVAEEAGQPALVAASIGRNGLWLHHRGQWEPLLVPSTGRNGSIGSGDLRLTAAISAYREVDEGDWIVLGGGRLANSRTGAAVLRGQPTDAEPSELADAVARRSAEARSSPPVTVVAARVLALSRTVPALVGERNPTST